MAVIGAKGRFVEPGGSFDDDTEKKEFVCSQEDEVSGVVLVGVGLLGLLSNSLLVSMILGHRHLRRWSLGLVVHQAVAHAVISSILLYLGKSSFQCRVIDNCSNIQTIFLLLVTVSTINLLSCVLDNTPLKEEDVGPDAEKILKNGPQTVLFGIFIICGAVALANSRKEPSCLLIKGPFRHYVPNVLWIIINVFCLVLTFLQLKRLTREVGRRQAARKMRMYWIIAIIHATFWAPLYLETSSYWRWELAHQLSLHLAFLHPAINPLLHLVLETDLRTTIISHFFCQQNFDGSYENESEVCRM